MSLCIADMEKRYILMNKDKKEYKRKYAINFDLSIEKLKEYYSPIYPKGAYNEIKVFMAEHGFYHRQYSGYVSLDAITQADISDLLIDLVAEFPWITECTNKMDATIIPKSYDLKEMMTDIENLTLQKINQLELNDYVIDY